MDARRTIDPAMQEKLDADDPTLAILVKVTRQDSVVLGFSTHDRDLEVDGVTYEALSGISATALRTTIGTGIDNMEFMGALTSDSITEDDLLGERYDLATVEIFLVDWEEPDITPVTFSKGTIGRVTIKQAQHTTEHRALGQLLDQQGLRLCVAGCSAVGNLGEAPCFADLTGKTFSVTGVSGSTAEVVRVSGVGITGHGVGFFEYGRLIALAGPNAGITREIKSSVDSGGNVHATLAEAFPFTPQVGDTYILRVGCDGKFATCDSRFDNAVNFQGFPHLVGTQKVIQQGRNDG